MELYDPDGTLLLVARTFAYNSYLDAPLLLVDEEGAVLGSPLPQPKKAYYLQDRRFSVVAMSHETNGPIERSRYEAFGAMTVYRLVSGNWVTQNSLNKANQSSIDNPFGFTGRRYDAETAAGGKSWGGGTASGGLGGTATGGGLWYYRNRMYSSTLGRFLQRDPAGYVDGFNLYAYVRNNPLGFVDALGLGRQQTNIFNAIGSGITNTFDFLTKGPDVGRLASGITDAVTLLDTTRRQLNAQFNIVLADNQSSPSSHVRENALRITQRSLANGTLSQEAAIVFGISDELVQLQIDSLRQQQRDNSAFISQFVVTNQSRANLQPETEFRDNATTLVRAQIELLEKRNADITNEVLTLQDQQAGIRTLFNVLGLERVPINFADSDTGAFTIQVNQAGFGTARQVGRHILLDRGDQGVNPTFDELAVVPVNRVGAFLRTGRAGSVSGTIAREQGRNALGQFLPLKPGQVRAGSSFENELSAALRGFNDDVTEQLILKTDSGLVTRVDNGSRFNGVAKLTEAKSGARGLNANQRLAFPEIERSGATVVSTNKKMFEVGLRIDPTRVRVVDHETFQRLRQLQQAQQP